nr:hypothetical protein [Tanacetum cinerariifolium]
MAGWLSTKGAKQEGAWWLLGSSGKGAGKSVLGGCLEVVGKVLESHGSGGDGLESGGSGVMGDGGKSGYQREHCTFQTGRDKVVLDFFHF